MAISSLIIVKPASCQTTPSVPEFTLKYVDYSYDVPPTYGINQYTGQNVTIQAGYHVDNRTMVFTIKNQPFTSYNDSSGNYIGLYYNFRVKGHYGDEWTYYPFGTNGVSTWLYGRFDSGSLSSPEYPASNSDYTTASINFYSLFNEQNVPAGSQLDFQVQVLIGQVNIVYTELMAGDGYNFTGESSDWSNTQTITIANGATSTSISSSTSANPTPTSTPAVPEFSWLVILPLFILMLSIAVIFRLRKQAIKNLHSFF